MLPLTASSGASTWAAGLALAVFRVDSFAVLAFAVLAFAVLAFTEAVFCVVLAFAVFEVVFLAFVSDLLAFVVLAFVVFAFTEAVVPAGLSADFLDEGMGRMRSRKRTRRGKEIYS